MARKPATKTEPTATAKKNFVREVKNNPFARELFALLLRAALNGLVEPERRRLAELQSELDSDGDGVADANDADPNNASVQ